MFIYMGTAQCTNLTAFALVYPISQHNKQIKVLFFPGLSTGCNYAIVLEKNKRGGKNVLPSSPTYP